MPDTRPDTTAPGVPGAFQAIGTTDSSVTLSWTAAMDNSGGSGVAGYRVFRNGAQIGGTITATQFADTGLAAQTAYSYVVRAVDNAGNVSDASVLVQTTTAAAPPPPGGGTGGLDARPDNTTCVATVQPSLGTAIDDAQVFPNLSFQSPVLMLQAPGDSTKWYIVEQRGVVKVFDNVNSTSSTATYIDLQGPVNNDTGEAGLLGMAFDPNFATNGRVYLSYTADPTSGSSVLESRISRFTASGGVLTPGSETILLRIAQPYANHNGGNIAFGPDGDLYAGFGDGGSGGDPENHSQNRSELLGKLIRIDVSAGGSTYAIPSDNPYAGGALCASGVSSGSALCPEIYAYGFRNPWRWTFDRAAPTPEIWLADVGQNTYEEVDRVERGGNYGWRFREGLHCYNPSTNCPTTANGAPLIDPVAEYAHDLGISVTGGYVYRGTAIASLAGRYLFGDFGSGRIFGLIPDSTGVLQRQELLATSAQISSFAQGNDGEIYYVDYSGTLFKIVPASTAPSNPIKTLLSQTGCVDANNPTQPAPGLIPYAPNAPFWSDGATKARWMALPNGTTITVAADGDWTFPIGTVLVKNFRLNNQLVETRLFMRHSDTGNWGGYTYRWNSNNTDATLVSGGLVATIAGQDWIYPSEAQCLQCHTTAAGRALGLETRQLNSSFTYPSTGRTANQLSTLDAIGMFSAPLTVLPAYPDPFDTAQTLNSRARAYLHTNCAQCHRPNGGTPVNLDLRYATDISASGTCGVSPASGDLGVTGAKIITPGDAAKSVLYLRMNRRDTNRMPPIGSHLVDTQGAALLQQWISGMSASCQ